MRNRTAALTEMARLKLNEDNNRFGLRAIDQWYSMGMRHALAWMIEESNSSPSELMGIIPKKSLD